MENKKEIISNLEYIFEPINAKVITWGIPFVIYSSIRPAGSYTNIFTEENKTTIYPITLDTKLGELQLSLRSNDLNNIKHAIGIAYSYSGFNPKDQNIDLEIQKRIYLE